MRLHNGYCPHLPKVHISVDYRFELIRSVALIFEKKHINELMNMATTLCLNERLTFQRYVEVYRYLALGYKYFERLIRFFGCPLSIAEF